MATKIKDQIDAVQYSMSREYLKSQDPERSTLYRERHDRLFHRLEDASSTLTGVETVSLKKIYEVDNIIEALRAANQYIANNISNCVQFGEKSLNRTLE